MSILTSLAVTLLIQLCAGYNLEDRLPLFKYGAPGSTFGFSVAMHKTVTDELANLNDILLVAGAPTAEATPNQPRTSKPGGIYYCPITTYTNDCRRVAMDDGGDVKEKGIKSNQWLGVSLESQGPGGLLMSCAHRWRQHLGSGPDEKERICGKCFLLNTTKDNKIVEVPPSSDFGGFVASPCELISATEDDFNEKQGYAYVQAGTDIVFHSDEYTLGAPGTWQWTGALFDITIPDQNEDVDYFASLSGASSLYQTPQCRSDNFQDGIKCNVVPLGRDSYMGFSVAQSDKIATDSNTMYYVTGAPRGNYTGVVAFFTRQQNSVGETVLLPDYTESVAGEGIASSFGYSIALTDLNGDGLDDLIVGAPQYYEYSDKGKRGGAVYVYINPPSRTFRMTGSQKFYGPLDSYFGHSVTALGDIDQDGFNDFAVGAPYENENGTVHIFRGSASGAVKESQVITASDFNFVRQDGEGDVTGFGASLSGNIDADSNKYPDLLIGTLSDHMALLRSRPIISVEMEFEANPLELDLTSSCSFGGDKACFKVKFCFKYKARHDEYSKQVPLKYTLTLDSERQKVSKTSRVFVETTNGNEATLKKTVVLPKAGRKVCPENGYVVYFDDNVKDKLAPIGVDFEFDLDNKPFDRETPGDPIFPMIQDPVLDADLENTASALVAIGNNCGNDGCQSDLNLDATMPGKVVVGVDSEVVVTVDVKNSGEEAHQAFTTIRIPSNVDFNNYTVPEGSHVVCYTEQSTGQSTFILCALGNPYPNNSTDKIQLHLGIYKMTAADKELQVEVSASTSSVNDEIKPVLLKSEVIVEYTLSVTAQGRPEQVRYKQVPILGESAIKNAKDIGPLFEYLFTIKNTGVHPASGIYLNVELPYEIFNGKWLLYLLSAEVPSGGGTFAGQCSNMYVNELQLDIPLVLGSSRGRTKREAQNTAPLAQASSRGGTFQSLMNLNCEKKRANCIPVKCELDEIQPGTTISAVFEIYLWEATFLEEFQDVDLVSIQTTASVKSDEENIIIKGKTEDTIVTTVDHEEFKDDAKSSFPWWYILIGIIATLLIYIVILYLLVKCGFFRRKKYPRQELEDEDKLVEEKPKTDDEAM